MTGTPLADPPGLRPQPAWRAVASLAAFAALAAVVIGGTARLTRARIAANETASLLATLHELVPASRHDNELATDAIRLPVAGPGTPLQTVYRARQAGQPVAALYVTDAPDGYAGPIRLIVAIDPAGSVIAVRTVAHQETPGIGDFIGPGPSPWLARFAGRSLAAPVAAHWQVRADGGDFDAVAGATVTSRAVVAGVRRVLEFQAAQGAAVWAP